MIDDIARILPSTSLMLAVLAVLMNIWHKDVVEALRLRTGAEDGGQKKRLRKSLRSVLFWKAIPLALAGALVFFVFLPPAWTLLGQTMGCRADEVCRYNPVIAAFLVTYALIGLLFLVLGTQVGRLLWAMR
jgi:sterol desaturase/sphingolipid hydroxylase (fatty acid hydroxylase superfamily)